MNLDTTFEEVVVVVAEQHVEVVVVLSHLAESGAGDVDVVVTIEVVTGAVDTIPITEQTSSLKIYVEEHILEVAKDSYHLIHGLSSLS